jgi:hypothetical protein
LFGENVNAVSRGDWKLKLNSPDRFDDFAEKSGIDLVAVFFAFVEDHRIVR